MHIAHPMVKGGIVVAIVLPVLLGCSIPPSTNPTGTPMVYVEPGWMAERRQLVEKEGRDMVACLEQAGWEATTTPDSGWDPPPNLSETQARAFGAAFHECVSSLWGGPSDTTEAEWRIKYTHALDTRDCLISHGYTISDPPSQDSWVEAGLAGHWVWAPFNSILEQSEDGTLDIDQQTWYQLFAACAQDGPVVGASGLFIQEERES